MVNMYHHMCDICVNVTVRVFENAYVFKKRINLATYCLIYLFILSYEKVLIQWQARTWD